MGGAWEAAAHLSKGTVAVQTFDVTSFAVMFSVFCMFFGICGLLWSRGPLVQLKACVFVCSVASTQLLVKALSEPPFGYKFMAHVTFLHMFCMVLVSMIYWAALGDLGKFHPKSTGSWRRYMEKILPIAISNPLMIYLSNQALTLAGAGLVAIIGALTPFSTAILSWFFGREMTWFGWAGVSVAALGCCAIVVGETRNAAKSSSAWLGSAVALGMLFAFLAVFLRSAKVVLQDTLLNNKAYAPHGEQQPLVREEPLSPMHCWALQAPPGLLVPLALMLCTESPREAVGRLTPGIALLVLTTCLSATILNVVGMTVVKDLGANVYQIVGKLNVVVVVACAFVFQGEHFSSYVIVGSCFLIAGCLLVERYGQASHGAKAPAASAAERGPAKPEP